MQSIFNRPEFLKALKTRVDRVSDEEREEFRKIVNDSYDLYESLYHSSSSWNNAIEMGWVLEVNNKYVLHPTDNISLRIQRINTILNKFRVIIICNNHRCFHIFNDIIKMFLK